MTHSVQPVLTKSRLRAATLAMATIVCSGMPAMGQYSPGIGATAGLSCPSLKPFALIK